jgi:lysophospholipase L1-like esterase
MAVAALAAPPAWASTDEAAGERRWVATWASSQQIPEPRNALPDADLRDATLRQVVRVTIGGERIRIRISNAFGTEPLRVEAVTVARSADPATARINRASLRAVKFGGRDGITIPAAAEYTSDPVELMTPAMAHLTVSLYLPEAPARQTSHPGSRATSYLVHGKRTGASDLPGAQTVAHWYQLSGVDIEASPGAAGIAILGDSITDGFGVQPDTDQRWPDFLSRRLQADPATRHLAVVNHGVGGNRVTLDELGPNALARFERDVLAQAGVRYVIVLEGVNDLGRLSRDAPASPEAHRTLVENIIGAYRQMAMRARDRGIRVIGATILPYGASAYYHPDAASEADRQAINAWIRAPGNFDAVIDFDAVMRDPADPARMRRDVDSGDGLHPSIAGYQAMANAVPLSLFTDAAAAHAGPARAITFDDIPIHGPPPAGMTRLDIVRSILQQGASGWPPYPRPARGRGRASSSSSTSRGASSSRSYQVNFKVIVAAATTARQVRNLSNC